KGQIRSSRVSRLEVHELIEKADGVIGEKMHVVRAEQFEGNELVTLTNFFEVIFGANRLKPHAVAEIQRPLVQQASRLEPCASVVIEVRLNATRVATSVIRINVTRAHKQLVGGKRLPVDAKSLIHFLPGWRLIVVITEGTAGVVTEEIAGLRVTGEAFGVM